MGEPQITYPAGLPWATVTGRLALAYADAEDSNQTPDLTPASRLRVTLTPLAKVIRYTGDAANPIMIVPQTVECGVDDQGYLTGPEGTRGVRVLACTGAGMEPSGWAWQVTITGTTLPAFHIQPSGGQTIDLTTVIPVEATTGTVQVESSATLEAVKALISRYDQLIAAPSQGLVPGERLRAGTGFDPGFTKALANVLCPTYAKQQLAIVDNTAYKFYNAAGTVERWGRVVALECAYSTTAEWKDGATLYQLPEWARPSSIQYQNTHYGARLIILTSGEVKIYTPNSAPGEVGKRITVTWLTK